jgi:hypothetical protein
MTLRLLRFPLATAAFATAALAFAAPACTDPGASAGAAAGDEAVATRGPGGSHADLVELFREWREFERPGLRNGAPNYSPVATGARELELREFRERLAALDPSGWSIPQQVDYHLVRAEMNGMAFNLRTLRPWARDPAFYASVRTYQSDTPAEEGPTIHHAVRLWEYSIWPRTSLSEPSPLSPEAEAALAAELETVPPLLEQARENLAASNARDLWLGGIRAFENQSGALERLAGMVADAGPELREAVEEAREATRSFTAWLEAEAPSKTGPSGIGRAAYTWYLRNVLLLPLSWEEEVTIMERELARSHASLRLEEHRNRRLPELVPAADAQTFDRMQEESIRRYVGFLEEHDILPIEEWTEHALRERTSTFSPEETRNFFAQATHRDPVTLWTHLYHWWDLARMEHEPHASPIRRDPLLYNIWMSRSEGLATVMEEWMMHAGLYDDRPRVREIVWIMLATRAARGLGSLHAHANDLTMEEAGDLHVEWTPRGWMRRDLDLLGFEQHLYLRQPGYGPSYVTGARLLDDLMAERARQLGDDFTLRGFFQEVDAAGMIPVSLLKWELTGSDEGIREILETEPFPGRD